MTYFTYYYYELLLVLLICKIRNIVKKCNTFIQFKLN